MKSVNAVDAPVQPVVPVKPITPTNPSSSNCKPESLPSAVITGPLITKLNQAFSGNNQYSIQSQGIAVAAGDGVVNITIPLSLDVPDFFDANMNITIQLAISGTSTVNVTAPVVDAKVSWGTEATVLSADLTAILGDALSEFATAFMQHIVSAEVIPPIVDGIDSEVQSFIAGLEGGSVLHQSYVLTSVTFSSDGLGITVCQPQLANHPLT